MNNYIAVDQTGYVIVDLLEQRVLLETFAFNRRDAWNRFCAPETRPARKNMGFACVFIGLSGEATIPESLMKKAQAQRGQA